MRASDRLINNVLCTKKIFLFFYANFKLLLLVHCNLLLHIRLVLLEPKKIAK